MKTASFSIYIVIVFQLFLSCNNEGKVKNNNMVIVDSTKIKDSIRVADLYKGSLGEIQIPFTSIYISLPKNVALKEIPIPERAPMYFLNRDSVGHNNFAGSLFMQTENVGFDMKKFDFTKGIFSDRTEINIDTCNKWNREIVSGDDRIACTVSMCNGYFLKGTVYSKRPMNGFSKFHLFGRSSSKEGIEKLLIIFSTLRQM